MGEDIVQQESDELVKRSRPKLKQLRLAVEESKLPLLPQRVLPGGWYALERPWALMDCPVEQVPQIPSAHDHSRVTVAILVSFPLEPLYFPDVAHMDCAIWVWKKASQKSPIVMRGETHKDGRLKSTGATYGRLSLPGYRHSVPVQEALKEARWPDFCAGHWGNRENPPGGGGGGSRGRCATSTNERDCPSRGTGSCCSLEVYPQSTLHDPQRQPDEN